MIRDRFAVNSATDAVPPVESPISLGPASACVN